MNKFPPEKPDGISSFTAQKMSPENNDAIGNSVEEIPSSSVSAPPSESENRKSDDETDPKKRKFFMAIPSLLRLSKDMIEEILLVTPVIALRRFQHVSRQWWEMMRTPDFVRRHTMNQLSRDMSTFLHFRYDDIGDNSMELLAFDSSSSTFKARKIKKEMVVTVKAARYGLVAAETSNGMITLWNPFRDASTSLPKPFGGGDQYKLGLYTNFDHLLIAGVSEDSYRIFSCVNRTWGEPHQLEIDRAWGEFAGEDFIFLSHDHDDDDDGSKFFKVNFFEEYPRIEHLCDDPSRGAGTVIILNEKTLCVYEEVDAELDVSIWTSGDWVHHLLPLQGLDGMTPSPCFILNSSDIVLAADSMFGPHLVLYKGNGGRINSVTNFSHGSSIWPLPQTFFFPRRLMEGDEEN